MGTDLKFQNDVRMTENCRIRPKISLIRYLRLSHLIFLQILPHFHVKNIFVAQKLTKWGTFKEFNGKSPNLVSKFNFYFMFQQAAFTKVLHLIMLAILAQFELVC